MVRIYESLQGKNKYTNNKNTTTLSKIAGIFDKMYLYGTCRNLPTNQVTS